MPQAKPDNNGPQKVLFITHNYIRYDGDFSGVFLHLLARRLREYGVNVTVLAPHDQGLPEFENIDGINIYRFRYGDDDDETFAYRGDMHRQLLYNPLNVFKLFRFIRSAFREAVKVIENDNIGVVNIHWIVPNGLVGMKLLRKFDGKIKIFLSSHGTDIRLLTKIPFALTFFKSFIRHCRGWTVVSTYLASRLSLKDQDLGKVIKVISLPNDERLFRPLERVRKDPNLVVAASRLTVQKRLKYLIEAVRLVYTEIPSVKLEIYGTGPELDRLNRQIEESGLLGRVSINEPLSQDALAEVYNRAGMVVLNSYEEGFGLALTEAMLCRTAVIGASSGGITGIIEHEKTGLLVPVDNSASLAEAIKRLIRDDNLRDRLAEEGYRKALKKYSSDSSARAYAAMFMK
jgi:glycosyltransferase involved in cell wall biosynthesis